MIKVATAPRAGPQTHAPSAVPAMELVTGIAWRHLPRELGVSPATAHRRLNEWEAAGVFARLHGVLLERLNAAGRIDWSASVIDGSHIRALQGGFDRALAG